MTGRTADASLAACIVRQFTDGHSLHEVLAAGRRRYGMVFVLDVLRRHGVALDEGGRLPLEHRQVFARSVAAAGEMDRLLTSAALHDDRRIADLATHIREDVSLLQQLLAADRERSESARRVVLAGERAEQLLAVHERTHPVQHRRRADRRAVS